jgi:hypothetical protein
MKYLNSFNKIRLGPVIEFNIEIIQFIKDIIIICCIKNLEITFIVFTTIFTIKIKNLKNTK